jgi:hypothetical protein
MVRMEMGEEQLVYITDRCAGLEEALKSAATTIK